MLIVGHDRFPTYYGTEFASKAMDVWAYQYRVQLDFIRPGKPVENSYIESYMDPARAQATLFENPRNSVAVVYPACL